LVAVTVFAGIRRADSLMVAVSMLGSTIRAVNCTIDRVRSKQSGFKDFAKAVSCGTARPHLSAFPGMER